MGDAQTAELFRPLTLAGMTLKNRIVMSPMTRGRSPGGTPNELNVEYYAQRASAGLVFGESTAIADHGAGIMDSPGIFNDAQIDGWKRVTDEVHARGGHMGLQLFHCGHNLHPSLHPRGEVAFGPSAIPARGTMRTPQGRVPLPVPRELTTAEMPGLIEDYRKAAINAQRAGFDVVEVHAGNGYLLDQFLRDSTNRRTDAYGGSPENRRRLLLEVVDAVVDVWGRERVGVRISPTNPSVYEITDSDPEALFTCVVEGLQERRLGFLDVVEGGTGDTPAQCPFDFGKLRSRFTGIYIANNAYGYENGNAAIRDGHADMIAFGRPYLANPDLVQRFAAGAPLNAVNRDTVYEKGRTGYIDYPLLADINGVSRQQSL
ncbi:MAG TPA: alkene reductase [Rhizobiaceae bacterium]|nr:alkene reductase [Rhizobiaceae bacterium]